MDTRAYKANNISYYISANYCDVANTKRPGCFKLNNFHMHRYNTGIQVWSGRRAMFVLFTLSLVYISVCHIQIQNYSDNNDCTRTST